MIDHRTPELDLPLPHPDNDLADDVIRLRDALGELDGIVAAKAGDAEVQAALAQFVGSAPETLDTLAELAAALGDDPNFAATVLDLLGQKAERVHTHAIAQIDGLDDALSGLAAAVEAVAADAPSLAGATFTGPVLFDQEYDNGNSGTAITIDWSRAHNQRVTLNANCALTFTPPAGVFRGALKVVKDNTATARSLAWPAGTRFLGNLTPDAPNPAANSVAIYSVYWDGALWWVAGGRF